MLSSHSPKTTRSFFPGREYEIEISAKPTFCSILAKGLAFGVEICALDCKATNAKDAKMILFIVYFLDFKISFNNKVKEKKLKFKAVLNLAMIYH